VPRRAIRIDTHAGSVRADEVNAIDWIAAAGAVTTALAALFTGWQAREVRRTVGEQKEDRRLLYRPFIDVHRDPATDALVIENIGRGVALRCVVFTWPPPFGDSQGVSEMVALGAGGRRVLNSWTLQPRADYVFEDVERGTARLDIAICEDELGTLYRFAPRGAYDHWEGGAAHPPAWIGYYQVVRS